MARKSIQGITIEIGGDTSKLQDALRGVESKLKDTQDALRDTNKLLKLDPGNVELLTQKQSQLTEAIQGTEEKLRILRDAAEDANQELAEGKISQAQFDALQREIIDTEQKLKGLKDEMKDFGSVTQQQMKLAGEKVKEVGDKVSTVGDNLTKYVTTPILALAAGSVAAFNEVDDGMDIIIKKTGATGDALDDMKDRAKNLATSIPTDFKTAGEAVGEVNTRFGLTGQALEDLSAKFVKFADLNDSNVTTAVDNVQAAMAAMNVPAEKAGEFLDIINKAAQDTGTDVNKLTQDMASNATVLRKMGLGYWNAAGFIANLNKNGVDASSVMTGLKTALKNATGDGKSMSKAMSEMVEKIKSAKSETKAMQIASELFGTKAGPAMAKAIRENKLSFDKYTTGVSNYLGSVDNTFRATIDPIDQFKAALNDLKIVGMELVEAAAPLIKSVAEGLKSVISELRAAWEGLSPEMQQTIIKCAGIAAAVGPVLSILGKLISVVGILWTALAANPITLVIAAVGALVAAIVYAWNNIEGFKEFWQNLGKDIVDGATAMAGWIVDSVSSAVEGIKNGLDAAGEWVINAIDTAGTALKNGLDAAKSALDAAVEWVKNGLQNIGDFFGNLKDSALNWGKDLITNFVDGIKEKWEAAKKTVSNFAQMIKDFLGFSEPKDGPLSDFHTYAPDMVDLFVKGLKDNQREVADQLARTFGMPDQTSGGVAGAEAQAGAAQQITTPVNGNQPIDIVFMIDGVQRYIYRANQTESQRVGIQLA